MNGRFADAMITTAGPCLLVVAMVALDERVRMLLASVLSGDSFNELVRASARAQRGAQIAMETAGVAGVEPVTLALLAVAIVVLAISVFRW
jgi:hypothetical protein